jgi:hypothetical protein
MRLAWALGAIWCATFASRAIADEFSGAELYNLCTAKERDADLACKSWIHAFGGALFYVQTMTLREKGTPLTCMPDGVGGVQFRLIIEKYLRDHPAILHLDAISVAGAALITAFPCKKSN